MSRETYEWLNNNILVGFTAKRGHAWHYKADLQGDEPNHYEGAIPVEDIRRRLFAWSANTSEVFVKVPATADNATGINDDGTPYRLVAVTDKRAIVHSGDDTVFGIFSDGYRTHQYADWLVTNLANIVDDSINFGSAGILKGGAVAFVTLEMPESVTALEGFEVRPHLMATTSHNGQLATTYKSVATFVVCDNTHAAALGESGNAYKVRHSKYSDMRITNAREALGIVHTMTENVVAEVLALADHKVSDAEFGRVLDTLAPLPNEDETSKTAVTRAETKRAEIMALYRNDERVAPWRGTALGVLQAWNTYAHHVAGTDERRVERNMLNALTGKTEKSDARVLAVLGL